MCSQENRADAFEVHDYNIYSIREKTKDVGIFVKMWIVNSQIPWF